jgi:hypothetical protein
MDRYSNRAQHIAVSIGLRSSSLNKNRNKPRSKNGRSQSESRVFFNVTVQYSRYQKMTIYDRISIIFLTPKDKPQQATKKRKRRHACQTSINTHPRHAPEGRPCQGSRSSRVTKLSIQLLSKQQPPSLRTGREDQKVFTLGCRGYTLINQGGICGSFGEPREGRIL